MKHRAPIKRSTESGFTLVELMAGLIIVSIISVMFLWSGSSITRSYRIRDSVRQVMGAVKYARSQAAIRNQNYRLQFCSYNKNCSLTDHNDLNIFNVVTPALAGFWMIEQCATAKLDGQTCGDAAVRQELSVFDLSKRYRDVQMYQVGSGNSITDSLMLYFRPDGRIFSCTRSGSGVLSCQQGTYRLCFRGNPDQASNGPDSVPRLVEISFSGRVEVKADGAKTHCK